MDEILWHRRESRRQTEKTNIVLESWKSPVYSQNPGSMESDYEKHEAVSNRIVISPCLLWYWLFQQTARASAEAGQHDNQYAKHLDDFNRSYLSI
jgi:hypothetical protein